MPRSLPLVLLVALLLLAPSSTHAGVHYSGETLAELPSRWRGFLLDHRALRLIPVSPPPGTPVGLLRQRYQAEAARLAAQTARQPLSADESADLGALYIRLGDIRRALEVLRPAQRAHPAHYRLVSNLGTAWQLQGDLVQSAACLQQAVRLSPGRLQKAEELQLRQVRLRSREPRFTQELDDLFEIQFVGSSGKYEPGRLAPEQRKKLPSSAIAQAQQLALWLPGDTRLLWQLGELAGAHGDVVTAAAIMDGCVTEFGLRSEVLQAHRKATRAAVEAKSRTTSKSEHEEENELSFKPRSSRPLVSKTNPSDLPPIDTKGINSLPWEVLAETTLDRKSRPTFAKYLQELDGRQVVLRGYLQPLGEGDLSTFLLIENPVGCWYCEMPEMTGIILVEMPPGRTARYTRESIRVTGKLMLNSTDPENFLYVLRATKVESR